MRSVGRAPYVHPVLPLRKRKGQSREGDLPWVYGAALRAASSQASAAEATLAAMGSSPSLDARPDGEERRRALMARAVASALRSSPSGPLSALPMREREAIGLARIVGMNVEEIARFTGSDTSDVKARMRSGLERLVVGVHAVNTA
jgi:DNA-directed RNA polymerase specialized sigma24 family protein